MATKKKPIAACKHKVVRVDGPTASDAPLRSTLQTRARRRKKGQGLSHPSADALDRFVQRKLPGPATYAVRMHLGQCAKCREFVEDLLDFDAPVTKEELDAEVPASIRDLHS